MKKIKLTRGKYAIVDSDDFEYLNQWKWFFSDGGYAHRSQYVKMGIGKYSSKTIRMHRIVNNTPDGLFTDHKNRNKLDNRKSNLRSANKSLNGINRGLQLNNTSGYKGVYWDSWSNKWKVELMINGKKISLGRFLDIKNAIKARIIGEQKYYATI